MSVSTVRRDSLPPLPGSFAGELLQAPRDLTPWAGASGPFWRPPRAVLRPASVEDVAAAVTWAGEHGVALIPRGGGTGMPGGNVGPHVVLDLTRLGSIHPPPGSADATSAPHASLRAGAGAVAAHLQEAARDAGWELPALPSSAPWCTLGGMVACNAAGARSFRLGAIRSRVEEVEWVRADGTVERLARTPAPEWTALASSLRASLPDPLPWPAVRKNSSGYALDAFLPHGDPVQLAVGSEGTLGVVTAATLTLRRPPEARAVLLLGVPELSYLVEVADAVREIPLVEACEYFGRRLVELGELEDEPRLAPLDLSQGMLLVELAGSAQEVDGARRVVQALAPDAGVVTADDPEGMAELWEFRHAANPILGQALLQGRRSTQFIEDCVVPPQRLGDYIRGLREILAAHDTDAVLFGHAGDGNLHVNPLVDLRRPDWRARVAAILEETVTLVSELGGTLAGEHGDGRLRTPFLDRIFHPRVVRAFREVKAVLDPQAILNPGVKVPVPNADALAGLGDAPAFATGTQGPERRP